MLSIVTLAKIVVRTSGTWLLTNVYNLPASARVLLTLGKVNIG